MKTYTNKDIVVEKQDIGYEVMDVDTEQRRVKAVWARTGNVDLDNDIIVPEAFTKTLRERGPSGKNLIWSLVDHCAEMEAVIGKPEQLYVEGDMLIAITPIVETEKGEDIIKLYEAGLINQHSIGFSTIKSNVNKEGVRTITELKLYEGSAVLWGANPETPMLELVKSLGFEGAKENLNGRLEKLLKGFKHGTYTDETFSLLELEIKQIQQQISDISTHAAEQAPAPDELKGVLDAINNFNQTFNR